MPGNQASARLHHCMRIGFPAVTAANFILLFLNSKRNQPKNVNNGAKNRSSRASEAKSPHPGSRQLPSCPRPPCRQAANALRTERARRPLRTRTRPAPSTHGKGGARTGRTGCRLHACGRARKTAAPLSPTPRNAYLCMLSKTAAKAAATLKATGNDHVVNNRRRKNR